MDAHALTEERHTTETSTAPLDRVEDEIAVRARRVSESLEGEPLRER